MAEAFVFNVDSLVTRDYLDVRLEALESRINGQLRQLRWMLGVVFIVVIIPQLQAWLG